MKKVILSLLLMFVSAVAYSQGVIGKWVTEGGDSQVEIYQSSIWLEGNNLKVRGYVAMFYETQTWTKK